MAATESAIETVGADREAVSAHLKETTFDTVNGPVAFDEHNNNPAYWTVGQWQDGLFRETNVEALIETFDWLGVATRVAERERRGDQRLAAMRDDHQDDAEKRGEEDLPAAEHFRIAC